MAFDTVRTNKMRSALTVLGVVIGITSIVGMTAMIRGFDQSLREMIARDRAEHDLHPAVRHHQLRRRRRVQGADQAAEPVDLRRARDRGAGDDDSVRRHRARRRRAADAAPRLLRHAEDQDRSSCSGRTENFAEGTQIPFLGGRFFNGTEVQYRKNVVVLGNTPYQLLFEPSGDRSDRQDGARRQRAVRGRRRVRQAAGGRRLQPRTGRLRRHPVHGVSAHLRPEARSASTRSATFLPIQIALRAARRRQRRPTPSPTSSA